MTAHNRQHNGASSISIKKSRSFFSRDKNKARIAFTSPNKCIVPPNSVVSVDTSEMLHSVATLQNILMGTTDGVLFNSTIKLVKSIDYYAKNDTPLIALWSQTNYNHSYDYDLPLDVNVLGFVDYDKAYSNLSQNSFEKSGTYFYPYDEGRKLIHLESYLPLAQKHDVIDLLHDFCNLAFKFKADDELLWDLASRPSENEILSVFFNVLSDSLRNKYWEFLEKVVDSSMNILIPKESIIAKQTYQENNAYQQKLEAVMRSKELSKKRKKPLVKQNRRQSSSRNYDFFEKSNLSFYEQPLNNTFMDDSSWGYSSNYDDYDDHAFYNSDYEENPYLEESNTKNTSLNIEKELNRNESLFVNRSVTEPTPIITVYNERLIEIIEEFESYRYDLVKMMEKPVLADNTNPEVKKFNRICEEYKLNIEEKVSITRDMFLTLKTGFNDLLDYVDKMKNSTFSSTEQSKLNKATLMLNKALNDGSTDNEKEINIKGALRELHMILPVSEKAVNNLRIKVGLKEIAA